jgi:hypothetical protein
MLAALTVLDVQMPTNVQSTLMSLKDVIELNFLSRDSILESFEDAPASYRSHAAGGLLVTVFVPVVALILVIVLLLRVLLKNYDVSCYWCVDRTFEFMFFSLPLRMVLLTFLTLCIVASMGEIWTMVYCPLILFSIYAFFIFTEPHELSIQST